MMHDSLPSMSRIFLLLLASAALAGLAQAQEVPGWPECQAHQVQVMLLGTYHMSNPGLDEANTDADDVHSSERQRQMQTLAERLVAFRPDRIAVEWSYKRAAYTDSLYNAAPIDSLLSRYQNEVIQLGFRLGRMLEHERVYPIDYPMKLGNDSLAALSKRYPIGFPHTVMYPGINWRRVAQEDTEQLRASTLLDYFRYINSEPRLSRNHVGMFGNIRSGEGDNFGGPEMLTAWYDRNLRMVHNVYRALERGDAHVLVIVGNGHVRALRHLLDEAPMFCPISPLPYLE